MNEVDTGTGTQRLIPKSPAVDLVKGVAKFTERGCGFVLRKFQQYLSGAV